jgi:hypothetical protein
VMAVCKGEGGSGMKDDWMLSTSKQRSQVRRTIC